MKKLTLMANVGVLELGRGDAYYTVKLRFHPRLKAKR
jgi:hypothetical protein